MKHILTTLAAAVAFASMSLAAHAETVSTTSTTTTKTVPMHHVTHKHSMHHTVKHTHHKKVTHHTAHHKGKKVAHKHSHKGHGVHTNSKEVNMDIPADVKIDHANSIVGSSATVPTASNSYVVAPATPAVVVTQPAVTVVK